jgi:hypothetical protein
MPENVQNRQVQSIMFVIMSSEGPGVRGQYTQTSGSALNSRAYCPDTRAFPYTETARLSAEEIFGLVSCPANTAEKYVPLLSD